MGIGIAPLVPRYIFFRCHFWRFQPKAHLGNCVLTKIFISMLVENWKNVFSARQDNYFPNPIKDKFWKHRFLVFLDKNKIFKFEKHMIFQKIYFKHIFLQKYFWKICFLKKCFWQSSPIIHSISSWRVLHH